MKKKNPESHSPFKGMSPETKSLLLTKPYLLRFPPPPTNTSLGSKP